MIKYLGSGLFWGLNEVVYVERMASVFVCGLLLPLPLLRKQGYALSKGRCRFIYRNTLLLELFPENFLYPKGTFVFIFFI